MANLVAPSFMKMSARRGLALHAEGESGDGLKPATVGDARKMSEGVPLSEDKWRRIAPWIARHISDLDAVQGAEITAGLVAMLLWGGGSSKSSARRAQAYAERIVAQLDAAEERAPAPKKDQIKGSDKNPSGSAKGKKGGIVISAETETALRNKLDEHNEKQADAPMWKRTTMGALKAVYRRGAGAFSTSHRPGMARNQWAMARVNAFLFLVRRGRPENPKYITDNDLLHKDHPKYSGKRYDKDQPREDDGKFGEGGGGGTKPNEDNPEEYDTPDEDYGNDMDELQKIVDEESVSNDKAKQINQKLSDKETKFTEAGGSVKAPFSREDVAEAKGSVASVTKKAQEEGWGNEQVAKDGQAMTRQALLTHGNEDATVLTAVTSDGQIAGAVSFNAVPTTITGDPTPDGMGGALELHLLGTLGTADGVGSVLYQRVLRQAAASNSGIKLQALNENAGRYWQTMGFQDVPGMGMLILNADSVQKVLGQS